jgi:GTPase
MIAAYRDLEERATMGLLRKRDPGVILVPGPTRTQYVDRDVTITEHRAPTDDSVKLLREMEAKAEAEVLKSVNVSTTTFECVVHQVLENISDKVRLSAIFNVNGVNMTATTLVDPRDADAKGDLRKSFEQLRDEVAKELAAKILDRAFVEAIHQRWKQRYP